MMQAIDLTKRYEDGLLALDHLNLDIQPGQIYILQGANSAGFLKYDVRQPKR